MSSVTRFLRQRQTGQTILPYDNGDDLYVLVAAPSNYVGNYPPSAVVPSTPSVPAGSYYRDMGKTIYAPVWANATTANNTAVPGYFRAVQLITPGYVAGAFGVGKGMNGNGLPGQLPNGANAGDMGYNTYYIPIVVDGRVATDSTGTSTLSVSAAGVALGEQL